MSEINKIQELYNYLNVAFSTNFMILQNLARLFPEENNNVFGSSDIFGDKSSDRELFDMLYYDFAEIRKDYFRKIRAFFEANNLPESFREGSHLLIDSYNQVFKKNIEYSSIFSNKDIHDWEAFNRIFENIDKIERKSSFDERKLQFLFMHFLNDYNQYKEWLSAYEIFEVLDNDITIYGSKSLYYGKPENPNVLTFNLSDYEKLSEPIKKFIKSRNQRKRMFQKPEVSSDEFVSLNTLAEFCNKMDERFDSANSHLMQQGGIISRLKYIFSGLSEGNFKITKVYIHKNEILSLITAMLNFEELHELANSISVKFLGKNVDFSEIRKKENT